MKVRRRKLRFTTLEEIPADAERVARGKYACAGQWNLAQVCAHLADAFRLTVEGFDAGAHRKRRDIYGSLGLMLVLKTRWIPRGRKLPDRFLPPPDADAAESIARMARAIERFANHQGGYALHPVFGEMTRAEWVAFHLVHAAHHLRFIVPA